MKFDISSSKGFNYVLVSIIIIIVMGVVFFSTNFSTDTKISGDITVVNYCGNGVCEFMVEGGDYAQSMLTEYCVTCPADCGLCPAGFEGIGIVYPEQGSEIFSYDLPNLYTLRLEFTTAVPMTCLYNDIAYPDLNQWETSTTYSISHVINYLPSLYGISKLREGGYAIRYKCYSKWQFVKFEKIHVFGITYATEEPVIEDPVEEPVDEGPDEESGRDLVDSTTPPGDEEQVEEQVEDEETQEDLELNQLAQQQAEELEELEALLRQLEEAESARRGAEIISVETTSTETSSAGTTPETPEETTPSPKPLAAPDSIVREGETSTEKAKQIAARIAFWSFIASGLSALFIRRSEIKRLKAEAAQQVQNV